MKAKIIVWMGLMAILATGGIFAQAKVDITGQVKDAQTKKSLEFCSIAVLNEKDSLITGTVTDNNGFFTIPVSRGYYHLIIRFIGYKNDTTKPAPVMEATFMGVFKLKPDEKFLKEVSIGAASRDNMVDRDVQVVTDKLKAGTTSTKEVLDKLSGVDLDRFNNSIKVDNDAKVIILVDGMEKDQEYIKNLAPDRLKKIEVIRDPGGRYALEGYSAVINIILKKDYQGTELFVSNRNMVDVDAKKPEYMYVQNSASGTINYTYNKVNVYAKLNNYYNNFNLPSSVKKEYDNGLIIERNSPDFDPMGTKVKQLGNDVTLGADYTINPKHSVSIESNFNRSPSHYNTTRELFDETYMIDTMLLAHFISENSSRSGNMSSYHYLFYQGKFNEKNTLNANFTFSNYINKYNYAYSEDGILKRSEEGSDNKNSTKFYAEWFHTFSAKTNLQLGYGNTWQNSHSVFNTAETENKFTYTDLRHKLYSYFAWKLNNKWSVKFGGAAETSAPESDEQKNSYLIFQPYADIKYKPSEIIDIKAKYRSASNYPGISQTNPFTYMIDQQSVKTGNPLLKPEVTHKLSLETKILNGLITLEPYYHFANNYITEIGHLRPDSIFEYNYSNMGNYQRHGLEANFTVPFGKKLFLQTNFDFYKSSIEFEGNSHSISDWTMSDQLVYVDEKKGLVAGMQYQNSMARNITAQGYNKYDNDFWIAFVQQTFLKKKLTVMLLCFLPVNLGVEFDQGSYIETENYKEYKYGDISFLKNMLMLEVSYRFNKGKFVNKKEKNIDIKKENDGKKVM